MTPLILALAALFLIAIAFTLAELVVRLIVDLVRLCVALCVWFWGVVER